MQIFELMRVINNIMSVNLVVAPRLLSWNWVRGKTDAFGFSFFKQMCLKWLITVFHHLLITHFPASWSSSKKHGNPGGRHSAFWRREFGSRMGACQRNITVFSNQALLSPDLCPKHILCVVESEENVNHRHTFAIPVSISCFYQNKDGKMFCLHLYCFSVCSWQRQEAIQKK